MADAALEILERELRDAVRKDEVENPGAAGAPIRQLVDRVMDDYEDRACSSALPKIGDRQAIARRLTEEVTGFGKLQPLMDDREVEEIWINGPGKVFCARRGERVLTNLMLGEGEIKILVERILRSSGRRLDLSSPFVDASLADGSRLHVAIPDVTRRHWAVNIRKFVARAQRLDDLVHLGSLTRSAAVFLTAAVEAGLNIVVSGGTHTGKTTVLNCLAAGIPPRERVVTCEEVFELNVPLPDVVSLQTRQTNLEGRGDISLRRLIIEALRMRPDRLIVGEVREREALDLLIALNSGMPGMATVHANGAVDAISKLTTLPLLAGENITHRFVVPTVARSIDLVVHLRMDRGRRFVDEVTAVTGRVEDTMVETLRIFVSENGSLRWTGNHPPRTERFEASGALLRSALG